MAESSLSIQLSDIAARVADYLGYGTLTTSWSGWQAASPYVPDPTLAASHLQQIMDSINQGLRWFYTPQLVPKSPTMHKWSFLSQQRTITVVANVTTYLLPDDYGGLDGELNYQPTDNKWATVRRTSIGVVNRALQQAMSVTREPSICAIYLTPAQGSTGQRWQITFAPTPDSTYTLTYQGRILPQKLTSLRPYPLGGEQHGETILEGCLAAAEQFYNDESASSPSSTHADLFRERLAASIALDVQENAPTNLGYCGDRSDAAEMSSAWGRYWPLGMNEPTYNGIPFSQL